MAQADREPHDGVGTGDTFVVHAGALPEEHVHDGEVAVGQGVRERGYGAVPLVGDLQARNDTMTVSFPI